MISPLLFDVFVDRLAREVKRLGLGVAAGGGRLSLLLYADDIVVLAESQEDLQKMMNAVHAFCKRWRLQVNMSKTKVMAFGSKGVANLDVRWGEEKIEEVEEYKYLGMWIEKRGSWKKEKELKLRKARRATALAWNMATRGGDMSVRGATSMWTALIRPHLEYGAEVINNHKLCLGGGGATGAQSGEESTSVRRPAAQRRGAGRAWMDDHAGQADVLTAVVLGQGA